MKIQKLVYIDSLSGRGIDSVEDIINDKRLIKFLWVELILNPELVQGLKSCMDENVVRDALTNALSWYLAFRWIFHENIPLDDLHNRGVIVPYRVRDGVYRQNIRGFLKGLVYAGLC
ncbi:MAG: hypothetical protein IT393_04140 [Nitrospirae bacterium]|nr:hypothetical protein [Nitrospirota bacterium]